MRENKMRLTPERWLPLPWEKDDEDDEEEDVPITEEEKQELLDLIQAENASNFLYASTSTSPL